MPTDQPGTWREWMDLKGMAGRDSGRITGKVEVVRRISNEKRACVYELSRLVISQKRACGRSMAISSKPTSGYHPSESHPWHYCWLPVIHPPSVRQGRMRQSHKGSGNNYGKGCNVVLKRNGS
jgi:hypothetical protein